MFLAILYIVLLLLLFLSFFEDEEIQKQKWILLSVVAVLTLLAAFRPAGVDKDYISYLGYYYNPNSTMALLTEPTFTLINGIARFLNEPRVIFVIYAFLAVPLKAYSITKLSPFWYMSFLVWFTHLFIIQEMTQIRVSVAGAIYLFSLPYLADGRKKVFALCVLASIFFHYSALFLIPLIFLGNKPLSKLWKTVLFALPILFYTVPMFTLELLYMIPIPFIQEKIVIYKEIQEYQGLWEEINVYNIMALCRLFTYYMIIIKYDFISQKYTYTPLLLKIFCYSICIYVGFSIMPVFAVRGQELIGVIDFIAIPLLAMALRPHWVGRVAVIIYALGIFLADLYLYKYLSV